MILTALKIQNAEGKFSTGGITPSWTKDGKTWSTLRGLKRSLELWVREKPWNHGPPTRELPPDWIVIGLLDGKDFSCPAREILEEEKEK